MLINDSGKERTGWQIVPDPEEMRLRIYCPGSSAEPKNDCGFCLGRLSCQEKVPSAKFLFYHFGMIKKFNLKDY